MLLIIINRINGTWATSQPFEAIDQKADWNELKRTKWTKIELKAVLAVILEALTTREKLSLAVWMLHHQTTNIVFEMLN